jgi:hypothetical protein
MTTEKRVKLRGVLAQTASSAAIGADGSLVVELYDFSDAAQKWLGNDVAFLLKLGADEKAAVLTHLLPAEEEPQCAPDRDALLLSLLAERFDDYYDVERWLTEHGIPFRKEFDPWA